MRIKYFMILFTIVIIAFSAYKAWPKPLFTNYQKVPDAGVTQINTNWQNMIPAIESVLRATPGLSKPYNIKIVKQIDITGDGVQEALVSTELKDIHQQTGTIFIVMLFKNGSPAIAQIDSDSINHPDETNALAGQPVNGTPATFNQTYIHTGGEAVLELAPEENGFIWGEKYPQLIGINSQACYSDFYKWNPQTNTFEFNSTVSKKKKETFCIK